MSSGRPFETQDAALRELANDTQRLLSLVSDSTGVEVDAIVSGKPFDDLGIDSLQRYRMLELLDGLGIVVPEDLLTEFNSFDDVRWLIETRAAQTQSENSGVTSQDRADRPLGTFHLEPCEPHHYGDLRAIALAPANRSQWRFSNPFLSSKGFEDTLRPGTLTDAVICDVSGSAIGYLAAYDYRAGCSASVAVVVAEAWHRTGIGVAAAFDFVREVLLAYDLPQLIIEVYPEALRQFETIESLGFVECGRLRAHDFVDGQYRDVVLLSLSRESAELLPEWSKPVDDQVSRSTR